MFENLILKSSFDKDFVRGTAVCLFACLVVCLFVCLFVFLLLFFFFFVATACVYINILLQKQSSLRKLCPSATPAPIV